jgi:hypothetical protein
MRIAIRIVLALLTVVAAWHLSGGPRTRASATPFTAEGCAVRR